MRYVIRNGNVIRMELSQIRSAYQNRIIINPEDVPADIMQAGLAQSEAMTRSFIADGITPDDAIRYAASYTESYIRAEVLRRRHDQGVDLRTGV